MMWCFQPSVGSLVGLLRGLPKAAGWISTKLGVSMENVPKKNPLELGAAHIWADLGI